MILGKNIGIPGVSKEEKQNEDMSAMLLTDTKPRIGDKEIAKAIQVLSKYKSGKANLEARVVDDEMWWELRHWEAIGKKTNKFKEQPKATSAWLFNAILNKHADAMDNYPEPTVLPREKSDEESAKVLTEILPVVMEQNEFEQVYSDNWWEKLKHGTAAYGVFWNSEKENGLGDVDIRKLDLLKLFWEPGVTDIQDGRNFFIVDLVEEEVLNNIYPQFAGKMGAKTIDVAQYCYDDTVDTTGKSVVVDWYYKVRNASGKKILHYVKFVGNQVLFASEDYMDETGSFPYRERGYYDHGLYPVVFDTLFPEKGTPVGFGYVAICKDPQLYIDKLFSNIMEYSQQATNPRFFVGMNTDINEKEFLDQTKPLIHVEGEVSDQRVKQLTMNPLNSVYVNVLQMKIEEMKDTAANRDVNSGGTGSSVTAAAAIAALQEAGNKASRDMIAASYRAEVKIASLCTEDFRQFYDVTRAFRIVAPNGEYDFVEFSNANIKEQQVTDGMGNSYFRLPVFDYKIRAQKKNPFKQVEENERAKELYSLGFFNPERAQEALGALEMMSFDGIDKVKESVAQGQTLLNMLNQMVVQQQKMTAILQATSGISLGGGEMKASPASGKQETQKMNAKNDIAGGIMQASAPMTDYGTALAKRSVPEL